MITLGDYIARYDRSVYFDIFNRRCFYLKVHITFSCLKGGLIPHGKRFLGMKSKKDPGRWKF
ncbi:Uncharacterized protein APZ42_021189 [Daphnia magna]|uniref:Uncharacterized protein n=1 Tax=Daphnia magna TaxID=35525 RepID=A0A164X2B2_9CRUS|nr:Uncharacterized protein APZ42_021189 [Daphnia magna]